MPSFLSFLFAYALGGALYPLLELLYRNTSHWSMSVAGGLSMAAIHLVNTGLPHWNVGLKCLLCAVLITEIEWIIGCAVNLSRKNKVWDYSHLPFHYHGQICLPYSLLWLALSFVALPLSGQIAVRIH